MNMLSRKIASLAFALSAAWPTAFLSAADQRTYSAGSFELAIDGVAYGNVRSVKGGDMIADVVTENVSAGGVQKKHVANIYYSPLRVEFAPDNARGLLALMDELLANRPTVHAMTLTEFDAAGNATNSTQFFNAKVSALELSAYDGSSKDPASLTLVFESEQVRKVKSAANTAKIGPKLQTALASNFRFELDGMNCNRVASVAALSVQRVAPADTVGVSREPTAAPAKVGYSNLILKISSADLANWQAWADNFFVQGHHLDADEKNGSLTQLGSDMKAVIFTIQFSHVGLVRFSESGDAGTSTVRHFEVELYYESASVATGTNGKGKVVNQKASAPVDKAAAASDAPAAPVAVADAGAAPDAVSGSGTAPADTSSVATDVPPAANNPVVAASEVQPAALNPTRQASLPAAATARAAEITPITPVAKSDVGPVVKTAAPVAAAGATGIAGAAASDPADQGVRDPREFMRIAGLVRRSYRSVDQEASSEETVGYSSKMAIDDAVAQYEAALKNAGWEEARKDESGSASDFSHYYHLKWKKTVQEVDLRFTQTKTGGTELTIEVDAQRTGVLSGLAAAMKGNGVDLAPAEGSPNDQGARDPADFPRIGRSTRKSYTSYGSTKAPDESVVYRAKVAITSAEAFYVNQLNQADWEQSVRREGGDPLGATHEITLNWTRGKRSVKINLKEIEPAITEITLSLSTSAG